jgi:hypothetical protein
VTAAYVILSMTRWMAAGQLLTKFGPFEVQAVEDLETQVSRWQALWAEENREIAGFRLRLEEMERLVQRFATERGALSREGRDETESGDGEPA